MRKFLEQWFNIKNKHDAMHFRRKLSIIYAFVTWNLLGVMFYVLMKDKIPEDPKERRQAYGLLTGASQNMHVYQVSGMTLTNQFDVAHKAKVAQIEEENEKTTADES